MPKSDTVGFVTSARDGKLRTLVIKRGDVASEVLDSMAAMGIDPDVISALANTTDPIAKARTQAPTRANIKRSRPAAQDAVAKRLAALDRYTADADRREQVSDEQVERVLDEVVWLSLVGRKGGFRIF